MCIHTAYKAMFCIRISAPCIKSQQNHTFSANMQEATACETSHCAQKQLKRIFISYGLASQKS